MAGADVALLDLDLAAATEGDPGRLYRNDGGVITTTAAWSSSESDASQSLAWGDWDGDGDLGLAMGNDGQMAELRMS